MLMPEPEEVMYLLFIAAISDSACANTHTNLHIVTNFNVWIYVTLYVMSIMAFIIGCFIIIRELCPKLIHLKKNK
jgi:hypothetical protein